MIRIVKQLKNLSQPKQIHAYNFQGLVNKTMFRVIDSKQLEEKKMKLSKVKGFLLEFWILIKQGSKDTWTESKWLYNLMRKKDKSQRTGFELREILRIRYDLV